MGWGLERNLKPTLLAGKIDMGGFPGPGFSRVLGAGGDSARPITLKLFMVLKFGRVEENHKLINLVY